MQRSKTSNDAAKQAKYRKVHDDKGQRVRGLWLRNGAFYAQLNPSGQAKQCKYRLDTETVPQAITAAQVLKDKQRRGELLTPAEEEVKKQSQNNNSPANGGHTLHDAIADYQTNRNKLEMFDERTRDRQDNSLNKWDTWGGKKALADLSNQTRLDFAAWRKTKPGGKVTGRTIDNDMSALNHVVEHAINDLKWIKSDPFTSWHKLDRGPSKKVRLLEHEELHDFCRAAFVPETEMEKQNWPEKYRVVVRRSNQYFSDYCYVLAYTGARERETTMLKWSYVNWKKKTILFPGANAKKGGGVPAPDREVDFNSHLEALLTEMYSRRDPDSEYIFPAVNGGHVKSFRSQLNRVRENKRFEDVGFHHLRHYFISWAVMSQPYIDLATIARWVGHRDNGALIMRKYLHLRSEHTAKMGAQLNLGSVRKTNGELTEATYDI